jgi:hypothetical protein
LDYNAVAIREGGEKKTTVIIPANAFGRRIFDFLESGVSSSAHPAPGYTSNWRANTFQRLYSSRFTHTSK